MRQLKSRVRKCHEVERVSRIYDCEQSRSWDRGSRDFSDVGRVNSDLVSHWMLFPGSLRSYSEQRAIIPKTWWFKCWTFPSFSYFLIFSYILTGHCHGWPVLNIFLFLRIWKSLITKQARKERKEGGRKGERVREEGKKEKQREKEVRRIQASMWIFTIDLRIKF